MNANQTVDDFKTLLTELSKATYDEYGSYSYMCGYLESLCLQMVPFLPVKERNLHLKVLNKQLEKNLTVNQ